MFFEDSFFEREIKCDYEISEMMKRAWAAQIEVLQVVEDVCRRNHLQYYAEYGTLLGAIRHQGFIPWDDDMDISLKREDYDRLVQILPHELPRGFAMGGLYAKEERLQQAVDAQQIRVIADETMWDFNDYMKYFHGFPYKRVGIDIFPLDYFSPDEEIVSLQRILIQYASITLNRWDEFLQSGELESRFLQLEEWCNVKLPRDESARNALWRLIDSLCSLYHEEESEEMAYFIQFILRPEYRLKKSWYEKIEYKTFENIQIPVPYKYHEVLTALYGDYMTPVRKKPHSGSGFHSEEPWLLEMMNRVGFHGSADEFCRKVSKGELRV
jgi:lipopolysaccharide cholinephosphotransferase